MLLPEVVVVPVAVAATEQLRYVVIDMFGYGSDFNIHFVNSPRVEELVLGYYRIIVGILPPAAETPISI